MGAWMTLYAQATTQPDMHRLLALYQGRLQSNMVHALRPLSSTPVEDAQMLCALIDGLYLRAALASNTDVASAKVIAMRALDRLTGVAQ